MGVVKSRWASWSSKPVAGRVAGRGGFDSHPLSPIYLTMDNGQKTMSKKYASFGLLSIVYRLLPKVNHSCLTPIPMS